MKTPKSQALSPGEVRELIALEDELSSLKEQYGIPEKKNWFERVCERYFQFRDAHTHPKRVSRRTYLWLCALGTFGVHQFYAGHWVRGLVYLALCWSGIPLALGFVDWMAAVPKQPDEQGMIEI
ncbi:MAG: TM2 domain-containing protein [Lachnospiraceae bacterium]